MPTLIVPLPCDIHFLVAIVDDTVRDGVVPRRSRDEWVHFDDSLLREWIVVNGAGCHGCVFRDNHAFRWWFDDDDSRDSGPWESSWERPRSSHRCHQGPAASLCC